MAGILNAAWKTNEDRLNLLPGSYNEELIEAAAEMIAESLPRLATEHDPGRHLDALPRRHERGDSKQADLLRNRLFAQLRDRAVVPDQDRRLRAIGSISYPPKRITDLSETEVFECWTAYSGRPTDWLHHGALARNRVTRLAAINRLFSPRWDGDEGQSAPQASVAHWLEALVEGKEGDDAIAASKAAVRTAASLPTGTGRSSVEFGSIVLTASGDWVPPEGETCLSAGRDPRRERGVRHLGGVRSRGARRGSHRALGAKEAGDQVAVAGERFPARCEGCARKRARPGVERGRAPRFLGSFTRVAQRCRGGSHQGS